MPSLLDRTRAALSAFRTPVQASIARSQAPPAEMQAWARHTVERIRAAVIGGNLRFLPYLDNGQEETAEIRAAYQTMLKEAVVKSGFLTKTLAVCAQQIQINPVDDADPRQVEAADFVTACLDGITGGTVGLAWSLLAAALVRGWNVCHEIDETQTKGRWAGKTMPRRIKAKEHVSLQLDDFRNVTAIRSTIRSEETYPIDEFILVTYLGLYEDPFGWSDFRAAYRPYWFKNNAVRLRGLHLDKFTGPYLKGTYSSPEQKASLESALGEANARTWCTLPAGALVDVVDLSMKGTADFQAAIQDCDREMLIAITGAYLQILEGVVPSGRGDTSVHKDTSELFQWYLGALLAQVLNEQLIPRWVEVNFLDVMPPVASIGAVNDSALAASLAIDEGLQRMGGKLSRKKVGDFYGRQWATDEADVLMPPAAAPPPGPGLPFTEGDPDHPFPDSWTADLPGP